MYLIQISGFRTGYYPSGQRRSLLLRFTALYYDIAGTSPRLSQCCRNGDQPREELTTGSLLQLPHSSSPLGDANATEAASDFA